MGTEIVEDRKGIKKKLTGRPIGMSDHQIPTGDKDMDGRCPNCGEVGLWDPIGSEGWEVSCANSDCRVSRFSIFVKEEDEN